MARRRGLNHVQFKRLARGNGISRADLARLDDALLGVRDAMAKCGEYVCVNGHDRCYGGASAGPGCPYCERRNKTEAQT